MPERTTTGAARRVADFPWVLVGASVVSLVLVCIVGLLIAFMQYQSRLARFQPALSVGKLVLFAGMEEELEANEELIKKAKTDSRNSEDKYYGALNEVEFRVSRICEFFRPPLSAVDPIPAVAVGPAAPPAGGPSPSATEPASATEKPASSTANSGASAAAESTTPSSPGGDGTAPPPGATNAPPAAANPALPAVTNDCRAFLTQIPFEGAANLKQIKERLAELKLEARIGGVPFSVVDTMYESDLQVIAKKNVELRVTIDPEWRKHDRLLQEQCARKRFAKEMLRAYTDIDLGVCESVLFRERLLATSALGAPTVAAPVAAAAAPANGPAPVWAPGTSGPAEVAGGGGDRAGPSIDEEKRKMYDLVKGYRFYNKLVSIKGALLSPADFLALLLVGFCGVLGALLKVIFNTYLSGKDPSFRGALVGPVLGLICALVVYILFRAGFIAITDQSQVSETTSLSPFVVAIVAIVAGFLSERTIELVRRTSASWLGDDEEAHRARWGVNLKSAVEASSIAPADLANALGVSPEQLDKWLEEKDAVPFDKQRELRIVLNRPERELFTDIAPLGGQERST